MIDFESSVLFHPQSRYFALLFSPSPSKSNPSELTKVPWCQKLSDFRWFVKSRSAPARQRNVYNQSRYIPRKVLNAVELEDQQWRALLLKPPRENQRILVPKLAKFSRQEFFTAKWREHEKYNRRLYISGARTPLRHIRQNKFFPPPMEGG